MILFFCFHNFNDYCQVVCLVYSQTFFQLLKRNFRWWRSFRGWITHVVQLDDRMTCPIAKVNKITPLRTQDSCYKKGERFVFRESRDLTY